MKPRTARYSLGRNANIADVLPVLIGSLPQIAAVTIREIRVRLPSKTECHRFPG